MPSPKASPTGRPGKEFEAFSPITRTFTTENTESTEFSHTNESNERDARKSPPPSLPLLQKPSLSPLCGDHLWITPSHSLIRAIREICG
jgi:hypothetical protein